MEILFILSAGMELLLLTALFLLGRKHVLAGIRAPWTRPAVTRDLPRAALIVPITGDTPAVRAGLASLLAQDYPGLEVVLVTCDAADPASALADGLSRGRGNVRHIQSGPATTSGQKNHNLLAGVAAVGKRADVYVFCDASHLARPDLARLLVEPLADGRAVLSGGFHRVVPGDAAQGTLGMLMVCMALHCLQPVRPITQPWGGAMAILRHVFEQHGVDRVWNENIVDDFSLGPHLAKRGIRTWPVALACLDTPLAGVPFGLWLGWFTRQLLYLKFCTPIQWVAALPVVWCMAAPPVLAVAGVLGALLGLLPGWWLAAGTAYLAAFSAMGLVFRTLSPRPVPALDWIRAFFVTFFLTVWCYGVTWTTFTMSWRGISYRVAWGGRVVEVLRGGDRALTRG